MARSATSPRCGLSLQVAGTLTGRRDDHGRAARRTERGGQRLEGVHIAAVSGHQEDWSRLGLRHRLHRRSSAPG